MLILSKKKVVRSLPFGHSSTTETGLSMLELHEPLKKIVV